MNWNRFVARPLLALIGFAATAWGAVQWDRLSADGVDAGLWEWAGVAGLFVVSAGGVGLRMILRTFDAPLIAGNAAAAPHLRVLGRQAGKLIAEGNLKGATAVITAADALKGAK